MDRLLSVEKEEGKLQFMVEKKPSLLFFLRDREGRETGLEVVVFSSGKKEGGERKDVVFKISRRGEKEDSTFRGGGGGRKQLSLNFEDRK